MLVLSVVLSLVFDALGFPAGRLLGPMVAAIVVAVFGAEVAVPRKAFVGAQGFIGCLIAHGVPSTIVASLAGQWPIFAAGVVAVTVLANVLGWLLSRWNVFPGDTAVWGSSPGAASAMMIMAEEYGADVRMVAFMQYLRVVCVSLTASIVAHLWIRHGSGQAAQAVSHSILLPPGSWSGLALTLVVALGGAFAGVRLRLPAGGLLLPMVAGIVLQDVIGIPVELPPVVLAMAYAVVGWTIGMRFNRQVLAVTVRSLPKVLASTFVLIAVCGAFGFLLVHWAHVDPLTAYFATSPGGADSVAIIAASTPVSATADSGKRQPDRPPSV